MPAFPNSLLDGVANSFVDTPLLGFRGKGAAKPKAKPIFTEPQACPALRQQASDRSCARDASVRWT